jgi:hypothetical protein
MKDSHAEKPAKLDSERHSRLCKHTNVAISDLELVYNPESKQALENGADPCVRDDGPSLLLRERGELRVQFLKLDFVKGLKRLVFILILDRWIDRLGSLGVGISVV